MDVKATALSFSERSPLLKQTTASEERLPDGCRLTQFQGYALMFLSAVLDAARDFLLRIVETIWHYPPSTSLALSAIVYMTFSSVYLYRSNLFKTLVMRPGLLARLGIRGMCAALAVYLGNIALARIPVGLALTLFATSPSITSALAAIFLAEPLTRTDIGILVLNIIGIALVTRPTALGPHPEAGFGVVAVLMSAVIASGGFVILKSMAQRVHFMLHVFSTGVSLSLISLLVVDGNDIDALGSSATGTAIAVTTGCLGFFLKICVNSGMQVTSPGPALLVRSVSVPLGFLLGLVFLNERLTFISSIGTIFVLFSVVFICIKESLDNQIKA